MSHSSYALPMEHHDTAHNLLVRREVCPSHVSESAANENVRGKMFLSANPRQADPRCQTVDPPFEPGIVRIAVGNHARKCKTGSGVPGRERFATFPKLTVRVRMVRILAVGHNLKAIGNDVCCSDCFERSEAAVRGIR